MLSRKGVTCKSKIQMVRLLRENSRTSWMNHRRAWSIVLGPWIARSLLRSRTESPGRRRSSRVRYRSSSTKRRGRQIITPKKLNNNWTRLPMRRPWLSQVASIIRPGKILMTGRLDLVRLVSSSVIPKTNRLGVLREPRDALTSPMLSTPIARKEFINIWPNKIQR